MTAEIDTPNLPVGYTEWRRKIVTLIENAKLSAAIHVNIPMRLQKPQVTLAELQINLSQSLHRG